ncbi:MBL fold metallo-hydrolase [Siccirubricoccus deserti]|uniref:MBL fold metallo-hydrolase n=1 Tax=Siccirubricoccus deserti TaxID=2013562 RepID=A0A9X0UGT3_9PROT|nr:MBL fold metallo-hydrolase [Siccirubricoccus deserti]MBC4019288.1 MBL fold metallo-hydrolase [Siccirubricoccus deserti]
MSGIRCTCLPELFAQRGVRRRQVLRVTSVGFVGSLVGTLATAGRTARAAPLAGSPPEVERLTVTMVADNYLFPFLPSQTLGGVRVERSGVSGRSGLPPRDSLAGEFGLSMLAESSRGGETRAVLVDFGYTPEVLLNNMRLLGIDPARIDALVLSHGHHDHFGGLTGLLAASRGRLRPGLPLFVGGEDCFCTRQTAATGADFGTLDRRAVLDAGLMLMVAEGPALAADHAVTSGQIALRSFETPLRPTRARTGIVDGLGCDPARMSEAKNTGGFVPDDFEHEIATSYVVKRRGLVVLTACSHRGVVNAIRQAQEVTGVSKLHAVIGGFHLVAPPLTEDYVRRTVLELKAMEPDFLVPAHCAGDLFYDLARVEMPGQVIRSAVGTRLTFGG